MNSGVFNPILILEHHATTKPESAFVKTPTQTITYASAWKTIRQLAYELRRLGVKAGGMVALDLPEVLSVLFVEAVLHEAVTSTMPDRNYDPSGAFTVDWFITNRSNAKAPAGSRVVLVDDRFLELVEQNPYGIAPVSFASPTDLLWVMYSSGTTGKPKAIPVEIGIAEPAQPATLEPWIIRGDFLSFLPFKTPLGQFAFGTSSIAGIPYLLIDDSGPAQIADLIEREGVRSLVMSPAQVAGFVGGLESAGRTLPHIEAVYTIGTAMSPELNARMRAATEGGQIVNVYGSAEGGIAAVRDYESDDPYDLGRVRESSHLQVVNDDGVVLPAGEVGRIRYRTSLTAQAYLGDRESSQNSWDDGWFYPGDLGFFREDGGLSLAGRASEIINAGGVKIDPIRLDQFATKHAGVLDAASFGYETADGIQQVGIALVTEDGFDVQALVAEFDTTFGPASPRLIARVASIPRNIMGKPLRLELAEKYREN